MGPVELVGLENLLRAQWLRLRDWIDSLELAVDTGPSVLAGWTVAELVAHLGRGMGPLAQARPLPAGTVPLTLAEYVGTYPDRAADIREMVREVAARIADDPLPAVERMAEEAFAQLSVLRDLGADPVVQARHGPVLLSTMVTSRLLELVVHGDDLARSTHLVGPGDPGPVEAGALTVVTEALLEVLTDRGGCAVRVVDPLAWLRLACGRVPLDARTLPAALRPARPGDCLPDLGTLLPLL